MEVAVKLENHDQQIKSLKHRMDEQEEQAKTLNSLAMSVQELALNMKSMIEEQKGQGERLSKLEQEPARKWVRMGDKVLDTAVGLLAGGAITGIIVMAVQYIK